MLALMRLNFLNEPPQWLGDLPSAAETTDILILPEQLKHGEGVYRSELDSIVKILLSHGLQRATFMSRANGLGESSKVRPNSRSL
jgi:hypothetical protein